MNKQKCMGLLLALTSLLCWTSCGSKNEKNCDSNLAYAFELAVSNDLRSGTISLSDSIEIEMRYAAELVDGLSGQPVNIENLNVRPALALKDYNHDKGDLDQYPSAKEDFKLILQMGERRAIPAGSSLNEEEVHLFEPEQEGNTYSLRFYLVPKRKGTFYFYWQDGNPSESATATFPVDGLECPGRYRFNFSNSGLSNFELFDSNQLLSTRRDLVNSFGILAVQVE
ncbi:MAG: hypothetical protein AAFV95_15870 [Bacteroidota bacterium]